MTDAQRQQIHRIFTATMILGRSGAGKTSLAESFAVYLWETYQRILLLYSWDGGAIPTGVQKRVRQGIIRFWRARTRSAVGLGMETLALGTKGYWPRRINPLTGETSPAVELVSPLTVKYAISCPNGHPIKTVLTAQQVTNMACGKCGANPIMYQRGQLTIVETVERTKGFEQVGGVFFDGLTSMADLVMDEMDAERGHGRIGGEKSSFGGSVISGNVKYGGNNRADIGFAQSRARQYVNNALSIPHLVEGPVFTGLTAEQEDSRGLAIVTLKLPGQAAGEASTQWFGNVMEAGRVLDEQGKEHFALYLRPYTDKDGKQHLLKTSSSVFGVPDVLVDPALDEKRPHEVASLGHVFRMLDDDLQRALAEDATGMPGVAVGEMEYGEAIVASPSQPPAATQPAQGASAPVRTATAPPPAQRTAQKPAAPAAQATMPAAAPQKPAAPVASPAAAQAPAATTVSPPAAAAPKPAAAAPAPTTRPPAAGGQPVRAAVGAPPKPATPPPAQATTAPTTPAQPAAPAAPAQPAQARHVAPPPPGRPPARAPGR